MHTEKTSYIMTNGCKKEQIVTCIYVHVHVEVHM